MSRTVSRSIVRSLVAVAAASLFAACNDHALTAPSATDVAAVTIRNATTRYLDLNAAIEDGFVLLHGCETRGDEGPVGIVYVKSSRLDATIDPTLPEGLIYAPASPRPVLVAVEFAVPYQAWTDAAPPKFLGNTFQREDEFGVFGLHVWVWRQNPKGMFAESNPDVSC